MSAPFAQSGEKMIFVSGCSLHVFIDDIEYLKRAVLRATQTIIPEPKSAIPKRITQHPHVRARQDR